MFAVIFRKPLEGNNNKNMIKVLLVDDHELVRSGFEAMLNAADGITVVGLADSGEAGIDLVKKLKPDVVLLDIGLPGIGGLETCKRILQHYPDVKVIALTVHTDGPIPQQILKLGAMGFISKGSPRDEMIEAVRQVMIGKRYLCSEVANHLAFQSLPGSEESPFSKLSQRESEVVFMILQGKSIKQMSDLLMLSDKTINTYRYRLYEKLNVTNDVELTRLAVKFNYIDGSLI